MGTTFLKMVFVARLVLGVFYLISGLNWIFGYIPVLPHIGMPSDLPIRHVVVAEMVRTGWMYQSAKILEIAIGTSLLTNRFVPLMLAATLPVAFITFMLGGSLIAGDLWGMVMGAVPPSTVLAKIIAGALGGLCVVLVHAWLMVCYFDYYRPALIARAVPKAIPSISENPVRTEGTAFRMLGFAAIALQAFNLYLFVLMIGK